MVSMSDHLRLQGPPDQYSSWRVGCFGPRSHYRWIPPYQSTSIRHGGSAGLVLDPIMDGYHLTRVLMDGGISLNLIDEDIVRKMGIDPSRIKPSSTTFKGVIPDVEARCLGTITLEVVFGSPDNFR